MFTHFKSICFILSYIFYLKSKCNRLKQIILLLWVEIEQIQFSLYENLQKAYTCCYLRIASHSTHTHGFPQKGSQIEYEITFHNWGIYCGQTPSLRKMCYSRQIHKASSVINYTGVSCCVALNNDDCLQC